MCKQVIHTAVRENYVRTPSSLNACVRTDLEFWVQCGVHRGCERKQQRPAVPAEGSVSAPSHPEPFPAMHAGNPQTV